MPSFDFVPIINVSLASVALICCVIAAATLRQPKVGNSLLLCGDCFFLICAVLAYTYRFPKQNSTVQNSFPNLFSKPIEDVNDYLDSADYTSVNTKNSYIYAIVYFMNRKWAAVSVGPAIGGTGIAYTAGTDDSGTWTRPTMDTTLDILKDPKQYYTTIYNDQTNDASKCLLNMCYRIFYIIVQSITGDKPLNKDELCTALSSIGYTNNSDPWVPLKDLDAYALTKNANFTWARAQPLLFYNANLKLYTFGTVEDLLDIINGVDTVSPFAQQYDSSFPDQLQQFVYRQYKTNYSWTMQMPETLSTTGIIKDDSSTSDSMDGIQLLKNQYSNNLFTNKIFGSTALALGCLPLLPELHYLLQERQSKKKKGLTTSYSFFFS